MGAVGADAGDTGPARAGPEAVRCFAGPSCVPTHTVRFGDRDLTWREFEGAVWYQVDGMPLERGNPSYPGKFGVTELEAFPANGSFDPPPDGTDLPCVTCRTLLAATSLYAPAPTNGTVSGCHDRPPSEIEVSEIYEDGLASASDELMRFMDERVRGRGRTSF